MKRNEIVTLRCTRGNHPCAEVCPDAFGVPCSPPDDDRHTTRRRKKKRQTPYPLTMRLDAALLAEVRRRARRGGRPAHLAHNRRERSGVVVALKVALARYYWLVREELRSCPLSATEIDEVAEIIRHELPARAPLKLEEARGIATLLRARGNHPLAEKFEALRPVALVSLIDALEIIETEEAAR